MNKLVKGAIAGAAGIALLMGGAGSLALWNDSASITDASISSGQLSISATAGSWTGNPALMVPGDTATYTSTVTITAKGTNLKSTLSIDPASITGTAALKSALVTSFTLGTVTGGTLTAAGANQYEVVATAPTGVVTVPVTVTVSLPSSVTGTTAQSGTVSLNDIAFKLDQHL
ncbi:MAG TPA: alternate-type signal peptide domain-containing protein [Pseudolysinimonas sp.]|nr:alternate-type signal peptide domain-containing protein [Pseudolysinimonas sp.]